MVLGKAGTLGAPSPPPAGESWRGESRLLRIRGFPLPTSSRSRIYPTSADDERRNRAGPISDASGGKERKHCVRLTCEVAGITGALSSFACIRGQDLRWLKS